MNKIYLVTLCRERKNANGGSEKSYIDEVEMIISDAPKEGDELTNSEKYAEYLRQKHTALDPTLYVVRYELNVTDTIDVDAMKRADALALLTDEQKQLLNLI